MGYSAGQLTESLHLFRTIQTLFQTSLFLLRLLAQGDVPEDAFLLEVVPLFIKTHVGVQFYPPDRFILG